MTKEQREVIIRHRERDEPINKIAKVLGLNYNTVKSFCQRQNITVQSNDTKLCENYGQVLPSYRRRQKTSFLLWWLSTSLLEQTEEILSDGAYLSNLWHDFLSENGSQVLFSRLLHQRPLPRWLSWMSHWKREADYQLAGNILNSLLKEGLLTTSEYRRCMREIREKIRPSMTLLSKVCLQNAINGSSGWNHKNHLVHLKHE